MKFTERIIQSEGAPNNESDLWLDPKTGVLKYYYGGEWRPIAGGGSAPDDDPDSGDDSGDDSGEDTGNTWPGVMLVEGTRDPNGTGVLGPMFYPYNDIDITFDDAILHLQNGGVVYFKDYFLLDGDVCNTISLAASFYVDDPFDGTSGINYIGSGIDTLVLVSWLSNTEPVERPQSEHL